MSISTDCGILVGNALARIKPGNNYSNSAAPRVRTLLLGYAELLWIARLMMLSALLSSCRFEDQIIFQPSPHIIDQPSSASLAFEDLYFETTDGVRLNGWFIPHPRAQFTLLWFHGNAGNIGHRVDNIKRLHDQLEINVLIFDYRGYGRSEGSISEAGSYLDGAAAVIFLYEKLGRDRNNIVFFGRSLGAAVAAEMARRYQPQGLILESPFVSIREMAKAIFPSLPISSLLQTEYDIVKKIKEIRTPLLVLHGDRDEVVPFAQGKAVFAAAPEPKAFYTIVGAGHNDTYIAGGEPYYQRLREFVTSIRR